MKRTNISLAVIACMALGATAVIAEAMISAPENKITSAGKQEVLPFPGHSVEILSEGNATPSDIAVMELNMPPKSLGAPPHSHTLEDEHFYVLEGEVTFLNGTETVVAPAGTLASLPRGNWHGFWNKSDKPARLLLMVSPSNFTSFFDEVIMALREENAQSPQAAGAIMGRIAASRGVTIDPTRFPLEALELMPK